ncbi:acyl-CoA carboxylase epsilon subunit-like protein [Streptomyces sp. SLBN-118]|uniref:acyl-CoA carboxylase subunit epsilon n=1 Tax=Streptomyces sp. SLBN-118 TaxID=2768454 RepID=UPI00114EDF94|nr:acyl-CoA carboxylase subunit epsilon [Streptomyces sp. SLBN-118]TQK50360.1 acyl-CoA carboxylase epsilon subunit-like protein [Streptomyces sp. SLBN-118]
MKAEHGTDHVVRVERGLAEADELAAVTVVLLSLLAGQKAHVECAGERRPAADRRRWEGLAAYRAPHSWQ